MFSLLHVPRFSRVELLRWAEFKRPNDFGRALLARSMSFHPFHLFGLDKGVYVERRVSWRSSTLERTADLQDEPEDFFYFQQRVREIPDDHCQKKKAQQQAVCYSLVCNCKLKSLGLCM